MGSNRKFMELLFKIFKFKVKLNINIYLLVLTKIKRDNISILMTIHAMTPKDHRESITEMMFELFEIDQFYIEIPGVLSFYHEFKNKNEDGIIIDSGSGVTNFIPILKGKVDLKNM